MIRRRLTAIPLAAAAVWLTMAALQAMADPGSQGTAAAARGDWPQWHGPNRDAKSSETGLSASWTGAPPKLLWQASGLGAGFSSPSIAGDRIFSMGDIGEDQFVMALSRTDGTLQWKTRIGPAWDDEYPGPRGTPTVDGDRVYAIGTEGDMVCLDAATGTVRWQKSFARQYGGRVMTIWKYAESPLVDGDRVVFTPGGPFQEIMAADKMTGRNLWEETRFPRFGEQGRDGAGYSSIVVSNGAGVKQYVQLTGRGLVGLRASDGAFLWGYNRIANDVANISTPIVSGDYIFASTGYQTGAVLLKLVPDGDGVKAEEVYFLTAKSLQNHHGGLVLVDGYIYGGHGHNNGFPVCVEMQTGKVVWGGNFRNAGSGSAAVLYADGHLYFRYQNGVMMLIEATPEGYREKGSFEIPGVKRPSWSHPVVLDGKLYLREQDHLYVYDVRG